MSCLIICQYIFPQSFGVRVHSWLGMAFIHVRPMFTGFSPCASPKDSRILPGWMMSGGVVVICHDMAPSVFMFDTNKAWIFWTTSSLKVYNTLNTGDSDAEVPLDSLLENRVERGLGRGISQVPRDIRRISSYEFAHSTSCVWNHNYD